MYEYTPLADLMNEEEAGRIGRYIAIEVRRQYDGPYDVGFMFHAWMSAMHDRENGIPLSLEMIIRWAKMIDPSANSQTERFRTGPIWIGVEKRTEEGIEKRMNQWLGAVTEGYFEDYGGRTAEELAYKAFEEIHPFFDGNGRTGKIIFNWLNDTLRDPIWPYNFWGVSNP